MDLAKVGNRHNWPNASCPGELGVRSGSSGIFLKMDRSKSLGNNNFSDYSKVFSGKTLYAASEFQGPSLLIMALNLTLKHLEHSALKWELIFIFLRSDIQSPTDPWKEKMS
jgi:hypothetical protein